MGSPEHPVRILMDDGHAPRGAGEGREVTGGAGRFCTRSLNHTRTHGSPAPPPGNWLRGEILWLIGTHPLLPPSRF